MSLNLESHPCFNAHQRHRYGRIHLPVAPYCNVQCKFCNRRYDCVNESRPGVTSAVLTPKQALAWLDISIRKRPNISVVGIAGPGDPFASADRTLETLRLVRDHYPEMLLCVASNGMHVAPHAEALAELAVSHVTITINAIDPDIGADIYQWFRNGTHVLRGTDGARILLERQKEAITKCKALGLVVKVNSIILPGINDGHIESIARFAASLGADIFNAIPLLPASGSDFEYMQEPDSKLVTSIRKSAEMYLPQMHHCTRCRADAVGLLGENNSDELQDMLNKCCTGVHNDRRTVTKRIAVATMEGIMVNQHLGNALTFSIFENTDQGPILVEERDAPPPGGGTNRWKALADVLHDCHTILAQFAGDSPREVLSEYGIEVIAMEGLIVPALKAVFDGRPVPEYMTCTAPRRCGSGCGGNGGGCGA